MWVVGITNAFNLLDNMDGLCAGIALIVGTALLVELLPGGPLGRPEAELVYLAALLGATAGFLVYNFNPASIFMGDSGSLMLGFSFAALTLNTRQRAGRAVERAVHRRGAGLRAADSDLRHDAGDGDAEAVRASGVDGRPRSLVAPARRDRSLGAGGRRRACGCSRAWVAVWRSLMKFAHLTWSVPAALLFLVAMGLFAVYLARIRVYDERHGRLPSGRVTPIVVDFMYKRRVAEILLDFCLIAIAYYLAYRLRFEDPEREFLPEFKNFVSSLPVVLASTLVSFFVVGVYRGAWRYFGMMDAVAVVKGVLARDRSRRSSSSSTSTTSSVTRGPSSSSTPSSSTGLVMLSRASFRLVGEFVLRQRSVGRRVAIYGAGGTAGMAVSQLREHDQTVKILGFIDEDPKVKRMKVAGYPVLGDRRALEVLVSTGSVDLVVIALRLLDAEKLAELEALCEENGVSLARLHVGFEEIVSPDRPSKPRPGLREIGR